MRFRSKTVLTGAIVAVLALGLSVPALAAEDETPVSKAWGGVCQGTSAMATALSELLDMSTDEIAAQRQDGKSLEDIAATKDVTKEDLVGTMLESRMAVLDQAVQDGRITQDQADLMLSNMQTRMSERVSDPAVGPRGGGNANGAGCGMGAGMGAGQGRGAGAGLGPRSGAAATQL
jgi:hypothetical protein